MEIGMIRWEYKKDILFFEVMVESRMDILKLRDNIFSYSSKNNWQKEENYRKQIKWYESDESDD